MNGVQDVKHEQDKRNGEEIARRVKCECSVHGAKCASDCTDLTAVRR